MGALPFQPERTILEDAVAEARARTGDRRRELEREGRRLGPAEALASARASLAGRAAERRPH